MHGRLSGSAPKSHLRRRILIAVGAVILISLTSSTFSLVRITEITRSFSEINQVSIPLERLLAQLQTDGDVLKREVERSLGFANWKDPHWRPHPIPSWLTDVVDREVERMGSILSTTAVTDAGRWNTWSSRVDQGWISLKQQITQLHDELNSGNREQKHVQAVATQAPSTLRANTRNENA